MRIWLGMTLLALFATLESFAAPTSSPSPDDILKKDLITFLEGEKAAGASRTPPSLTTLRRYPITATTAYLLLENDPRLMKEFYPELSDLVMRLFADANLAGDGLIRGMPGAGEGKNTPLSPDVNALADIELYSLHLIAWKTGAYEDALEFLAWSRTLSEAITRSFYDPSRQLFFPLDGRGFFIAAHSPGQLLPLITDMSLGSSTHERITAAFLEQRAGLQTPTPNRLGESDAWNEPTMRLPIINLLSVALEGREPLATLRALPEVAAAAEDSTCSTWSAFWLEEPLRGRHLFPRWSAISCLVNLTLLLERDSLLQPQELSALRSSVDSLASELAAPSITLDAYIEATGTVNRLLTRVERLAQLLDSQTKSWTVIKEGTWLRISPRIKRIVKESFASSIAELSRVKSRLSTQLERDQGITFRLDLPVRPLLAGKQVAYTATLQVTRDTLTASRLYLQIADRRWKMMESDESLTLVPGAAPLRYENSVPLVPTGEPGIVTLPAFIDFVTGGRRVEIHRVESVMIEKAYDAVLNLPEGRTIREKPVPIEIVLTHSPDHDVQGEVEGTFLRELATTPSLPSRFVVGKDSEHTTLSLQAAPRGTLSPGRYPFSLTVSLDGTPVSSFEESLVRPFRWLHLGPLATSSDALKNGPAFQDNLFRTYASADGRMLRWQEVPSQAIDGDGTLCTRYLYGDASEGCMLLYTAVDAPSLMKLLGTLKADDPVFLWVNGEPIISAGEPGADAMEAAIELRKGPNSILIACCWDHAPGCIAFELSEESGLPPTGLGNDLGAIVDGYERLSANEPDVKKETSRQAELQEIVITYYNPEAREVSVIGSFNNWEVGATQMKRAGKGNWTARIALRAGKYPYKLVVNRKMKIADPANNVTEPDGFGGFNSVLQVH